MARMDGWHCLGLPKSSGSDHSTKHTTMPPAKLSPASPAFMLLGGISSLPSGTLVRGLLHKPKTTPQRYRDVEAEWDFFQLRTYGVGIPECASKMKRRSEASDRG
ncbi:hypothetical protein HC256_005328 [Beauveria bassiana]|nr:hypothetical protein HC256_005328 [Beauveria bassiana]